MKFPSFFLCYMFIVIVIVISMDLMCKNDYMCAMLLSKPSKPQFRGVECIIRLCLQLAQMFDLVNFFKGCGPRIRPHTIDP